MWISKFSYPNQNHNKSKCSFEGMDNSFEGNPAIGVVLPTSSWLKVKEIKRHFFKFEYVHF